MLFKFVSLKSNLIFVYRHECRIDVDIMTGKNGRKFSLLSGLVYWSVNSSMIGDGVKWWKGRNRYFSPL